MWSDIDFQDLTVNPLKKPCFLSGTLVKTDQGLIPIEQITAGQQVYARNMLTGLSELKQIKQTYTNFAEMYIRIQTASDIISATGQHRFWLPKEQRWCMANSLEVGMFFLTYDGAHSIIQALEIINDQADTYNLEIEDHHNYFVGQDEILTHNQSINPKSKFYQAEAIEVLFYGLIDAKQKFETVYIGQTIQDIVTRYGQHRRDIQKAKWMNGFITIIETTFAGKMWGHMRMSPYEAAVIELYHINNAGGRMLKDPDGKLYNKQKPIGESKFNLYKALEPPRDFNPCRFFV